MSDLANRVVVFTGGETGIGRASVLELAAEGATIVIGGILEEEGAKTVQDVRDAGGKAEFHRVDVREAAQVDALIDGAVATHGRIDGLVCSAAVFDGFASGIDTTDGLWDHIMDVNARGTFFACRAALRHMVKAGHGRIVNVASIGGLVGMADGASYTASKHAVVGLTKHLGCFFANQGITVNAVCPGAIETQCPGQLCPASGGRCPADGRRGRQPGMGQDRHPHAAQGPGDRNLRSHQLPSQRQSQLCHRHLLHRRWGLDGEMTGADLSDDERGILEAVSRFVEERVRPRISDLEQEGLYPEALVNEMKALGLFGIAVPEEFGGLGLRPLAFAALMEVLARGWTTLAAYVNSHSTVAHAIAHHGTAAQKARLLPGLAEGAHRGALCLTEPGAGSDLQSIRGTARREGNGYALTASKTYVTNGAKASVFLTLARLGQPAEGERPRFGLFLVERAKPGVTQTSIFHKTAFPAGRYRSDRDGRRGADRRRPAGRRRGQGLCPTDGGAGDRPHRHRCQRRWPGCQCPVRSQTLCGRAL